MTESIGFTNDQTEIAFVFIAKTFIFTHHLRDRLYRRQRVLDLVRDSCGHASERSQTFSFGEFSFQSQVFFQQSRVVDRERDLIREQTED